MFGMSEKLDSSPSPNEEFEGEEDVEEVIQKLIDEKRIISKRKHLQFVHTVKSFSSHWGSAGNTHGSYGANAVLGKPKMYPGSGNSGSTWCPASYQTELEYLHVTFKKPVVPLQVRVYETNIPGAVRRILAKKYKSMGDQLLRDDEDKDDDSSSSESEEEEEEVEGEEEEEEENKNEEKEKEFSKKSIFREKDWVVLWEGTSPYPPGTSRMFTPMLDLKKVREEELLTNEIRVETGRMSGWYQIDAIELVGCLSTQRNVFLTPLGSDLLKMLKDPLFHDICLTFDDNVTEFKAHKVILSARCPFFGTMFTCGLSESLDDSKVFQCRIENVDPRIFYKVLEYIYGGSVLVSDVQIIPMYIAADQYLLQSLALYLSKIFKSVIDEENVIYYLKLTDEYMCERLKVSCIDFIVKNYITVMKSTDFSTLSKELILDVMMRLGKKKKSDDVFNVKDVRIRRY